MRWRLLTPLLAGIVLVGCRDKREWDADGDGFDAASHGGLDCQDRAAGVNPAAMEQCNGIDDDCDGIIDDADPSLDPSSVRAWYPDRDGDGNGDVAGEEVQLACSAPPGFAGVASDCDDTDPTRYPGAVETCDGVDEDCDGVIDDVPDAPQWFRDLDGDGQGAGAPVRACERPAADYVEGSADCDDSRPEVGPGAPERCNNRDDDCDGLVDDDDPDEVPADAGTWYPDDDGDGFGRQADWRQACTPLTSEVGSGGDCDDTDSGVHPGAPERCDLVDNDCDGAEDEDPEDGLLRFSDNDLDGYGVFAAAVRLCEESPGFVETAGDCADARPAVNPAAQEICDRIDNDCDGAIDGDDDSVDGNLQQLFVDDDLDGFGTGETPTVRCFNDGPWSEVPGDCDDDNDEVNPLQIETCGNGVDDDCIDQSALCGLEGSGDLTFRFTTHVVTGAARSGTASFATQVIPADMDGDGHEELLVLTRGKARTVIQLAGPIEPGASFELDHTALINADVRDGAVFDVGDLDLDGIPDIALGDGDLGSGQGVPSFDSSVWSVLGPITTTQELDWQNAERTQLTLTGLKILPDLSGDGLPDELERYQWGGIGLFSPSVTGTPTGWCSSEGCAESDWGAPTPGGTLDTTIAVDVNGDDQPDAVSVDGNNGAAVYLGPIPSRGPLKPSWRVTGPSDRAIQVRAELDDLDGDGVTEIWYQGLNVESSNAIASAQDLMGTGDRVLAGKWTLPPLLDKVRVLVAESPWTPGERVLIVQNGTTLMVLDAPPPGALDPAADARLTLALPEGAVVVGTVDVDRDGLPNLVVAHPKPGGAGRLYLFYPTGE